MKPDEVRQVVQERYGKFAESASHAEDSCCSKPAVKACCAHEQAIYSGSELSSVPEIARNLSRGCGNPTGFANLQPGEAVVDLGCGGGIDMILAARKVGAGGKVYGVDFTLPMIEQAKEAVAQAGLPDRSVEFRHASLETTTLPDDSADVAMSNCVINLCPDKNAVYREAFRILKPGGRLAISDIMLTGPIDTELRERLQSAWAGCTGGAIPEGECWNTLKNAGFTEINVVARHLLSDPELDGMACCPGVEYTPAPAADDLNQVYGKVESVKFTAIK